MPPTDVARWNGAVGRADVLADREVDVVAAQSRAGIPGRVPELRVARIEIEIRLAAQAAHDRVERQVPADVQQQVRGFGRIQHFAVRHARGPLTGIADQRRDVRQPGVPHHVLEIRDVGTPFERDDKAVLVDAVLRRDLLDVVRAHAEPSEPVHPVQDGARVAPVSTLRRNHAGHHDRGHLSTAAGAAGARRTARTGGPTRAAR